MIRSYKKLAQLGKSRRGGGARPFGHLDRHCIENETLLDPQDQSYVKSLQKYFDTLKFLSNLLDRAAV